MYAPFGLNSIDVESNCKCSQTSSVVPLAQTSTNRSLQMQRAHQAINRSMKRTSHYNAAFILFQSEGKFVFYYTRYDCIYIFYLIYF